MSSSENEDPPDLQNSEIPTSAAPAIVPPVQLLTLTSEQLTSLISNAVDAALQRRDFNRELEHSSDTSLESDMPIVPEQPISHVANPSVSQRASTTFEQPSTSVPFSSNSPTAAIVREKITNFVATKDHRKTTPLTMTEIEKNRISPSDNDKHARLIRLHRIIRADGLLSLLLGIRPKPVIDPVYNPYGYNPRCVITSTQNAMYDSALSDTLSISSHTTTSSSLILPQVVPTITTWVIDADDMQCYDHDMSRLFALVTHMFSFDYHCYVSMESEYCEDPIHYYTTIRNVIFGHRPKDILHARQQFFNFQLNYSKSIQFEYARWEQLIKNIRFASMDFNAIPDSEKLAFVVTLFQNDKRPGIANALSSCQSLDYDYTQTMEVILRIAHNLSDAHGIVKMAALPSTQSSSSSSNVTAPKNQFCFKFQRNQCNKGDQCKYKHQIDPDFKPRHPIASGDKGAKSASSAAKEPSSQTRSSAKVPDRKPFSVSLSPAQQSIVGAPAGVVSAHNTQGYSHRQQLVIKAMLAVTTAPVLSSITIDQPPTVEQSTDNAPDYSAWQYPSENNFTASQVDSLTLRQSLKYLHFDFDDHHTLRHKRESTEITDQTKDYSSAKYKRVKDMKILSPYLLHNLVNDFAPSTSISRILATSIHHIEAYYSVDNRTGEFYSRQDPTVSLEPLAWLQVQTTKGRTSNISLLYNWNMGPLSILNHKRVDIMTLQREWMLLILTTGQILLQAIINISDPPNVHVGYEFNTFNRRHPYRRSLEFGHYWSQMTSIHDYVTIHQQLQNLSLANSYVNNTLYIDTAIHVLIYDFMAFTAQYLGYFRNSNDNLVYYLRCRLDEECDLITCPLFINSGLYTMFKSIITFSGPCRDDIKRCIPTDLTRSVELSISKKYRLIPYPGTPTRPETPDDVSIGEVLSDCDIESTIDEPSQANDQSPSIQTSPISFPDSSISKSNITNASSYAITYLPSLKSIHRLHRCIIDTGASVSATSEIHTLSDIHPCMNMTAYPAFGPPITPTQRGSYGPLKLDTVVIDNMPDTLLSVSQICNGGKSQSPNIAVFTSEGVRIYNRVSVSTELQAMNSKGIEILRGYMSDGIYTTQQNTSTFNSCKATLYLANFKPASLYDHVHMVTGHPGVKGMMWHQKNSLNAKFTTPDASRQRGTCKGCVYGSLAQSNTDHTRVHRDLPQKPGQCFSLDAYTNTFLSSRGHKYCDIYTDLATRRCYPVYTKGRTAQELCEKSLILFNQHPEWKYLHDTDTRRFIRLDAESSYRSLEFLAFVASVGYSLERTPVRDKHAGGIAERAVGVIVAKTNVAMLSANTTVPQSFWDFAMSYACDTHSYNYSSVIGTSPYTKITGQPVNVKYLQPFWASCYVFIPLSKRNKLGDPRAYKAHFVGYSNTSLCFPNYFVIPVLENGHYGKVRESKDVIFDPTINFSIYTEDEEPYDREFVNTDHYVPFIHRTRAPAILQGATAQPVFPISEDTFQPDFPLRSPVLQPPVLSTDPIPSEDTTDQNVNTVNDPYEDEHGHPIYWYNFTVRNHEYAHVMCETQHFSKLSAPRDPRVPTSFSKAVLNPLWKASIDKECDKFAKNNCFIVVPYNGQHLVPMMWLFTIKTDGTLKSRLVGRGDLMQPYVDFDPNAVYCGNVSACSIKMCLSIAAKYKLVMRGGDLEGAYLVTRANKDYPVHIKTPEGYNVPQGYCIQAIGNLYGFPPAGQNFSIEFDKCVMECGYTNTPWDLKFFYKWIDGRLCLLIAHSDDFRWFGDSLDLAEWDLLVNTFHEHNYKVTDATDKEFVGINITIDSDFNYYIDQTRMIEEILDGIGMKNCKDESMPYPLLGDSLSKLDNASPAQLSDCAKFPYRRIVGQLMYGMVHTMMPIMYALNVLSRYGNNPGPRHIEFAKHLLRYVKTSRADRIKFATHNGPRDIITMTELLQLRFQCDADLAGNPDNLHSQTSYLGYLGGSLICWCSTDQGSVSTSTAESEIKAVNHTLKAEVIANRGILNTMGWIQAPTVIEEDNKACVDASIVRHMTRGLRHLAITENFLKEKYADKTCVLVKVPSGDNNSDIGTKRVTKSIFEFLTHKLIDRSLRDVNIKVKVKK